jgi:hypothetical protein
MISYDLLDLPCHLEVARAREAVGDDRALERHDRPMIAQGVPYVAPVANVVHLTTVRQRRSRLGGPRQTCETGRVTTPEAPESGTQSTVVEERTDYRLDEGDHERFSHYADREKITEAMVMGTPIRALCGKVWVPSRDPKRFPVCPECKEIFESLEE